MANNSNILEIILRLKDQISTEAKEALGKVTVATDGATRSTEENTRASKANTEAAIVQAKTQQEIVTVFEAQATAQATASAARVESVSKVTAAVEANNEKQIASDKRAAAIQVEIAEYESRQKIASFVATKNAQQVLAVGIVKSQDRLIKKTLEESAAVDVYLHNLREQSFAMELAGVHAASLTGKLEATRIATLQLAESASAAGATAIAGLGESLAALGAKALATGGKIAAFAAGAAALAGLYEIGKAVTGAIEDSRKLESAYTRLDNALQNTGNYSQETAEKYRLLAKELSAETPFTIFETIDVEQLLISFGLVGDELRNATKAALDFAAKFPNETTLNAAVGIGEALSGNTQILRRHGIQIDAITAKEQGLGAVLKALNNVVGGAATVAAQTYAGKINNLKEQITLLSAGFGDLITKNTEINALVLAATDLLKDYNFQVKSSADKSSALSDAFDTIEVAAIAVGEGLSIFIDELSALEKSYTAIKGFLAGGDFNIAERNFSKVSHEVEGLRDTLEGAGRSAARYKGLINDLGFVDVNSKAFKNLADDLEKAGGQAAFIGRTTKENAVSASQQYEFYQKQVIALGEIYDKENGRKSVHDEYVKAVDRLLSKQKEHARVLKEQEETLRKQKEYTDGINSGLQNAGLGGYADLFNSLGGATNPKQTETPGPAGKIVPLPAFLGPNRTLEEHAAKALVAAAADLAKTSGIHLKISSDYRSYGEQLKLYNRYQAELARGNKNATPAAKPGSSNHESGLAIDLPGNLASNQKIIAALARQNFIHPAGLKNDPYHFDFKGGIKEGQSAQGLDISGQQEILDAQADFNKKQISAQEKITSKTKEEAEKQARILEDAIKQEQQRQEKSLEVVKQYADQKNAVYAQAEQVHLEIVRQSNRLEDAQSELGLRRRLKALQEANAEEARTAIAQARKEAQQAQEEIAKATFANEITPEAGIQARADIEEALGEKVRQINAKTFQDMGKLVDAFTEFYKSRAEKRAQAEKDAANEIYDAQKSLREKQIESQLGGINLGESINTKQLNQNSIKAFTLIAEQKRIRDQQVQKDFSEGRIKTEEGRDAKLKESALQYSNDFKAIYTELGDWHKGNQKKIEDTAKKTAEAQRAAILSLRDSYVAGFKDITAGAHNMGDVFKNVLKRIKEQAIEAVIEVLALKLAASAAGGGDVAGGIGAFLGGGGGVGGGGGNPFLNLAGSLFGAKGGGGGGGGAADAIGAAASLFSSKRVLSSTSPESRRSAQGKIEVTFTPIILKNSDGTQKAIPQEAQNQITEGIARSVVVDETKNGIIRDTFRTVRRNG